MKRLLRSSPAVIGETITPTGNISASVTGVISVRRIECPWIRRARFGARFAFIERGAALSAARPPNPAKDIRDPEFVCPQFEPDVRS
jgi:hypothetical protein